jgi:hypothetical protein
MSWLHHEYSFPGRIARGGLVAAREEPAAAALRSRTPTLPGGDSFFGGRGLPTPAEQRSAHPKKRTWGIPGTCSHSHRGPGRPRSSCLAAAVAVVVFTIESALTANRPQTPLLIKKRCPPPPPLRSPSSSWIEGVRLGASPLGVFPPTICLCVYLFISSKLSRSSAPALHCSPRSPTRADPPGVSAEVLAGRASDYVPEQVKQPMVLLEKRSVPFRR